MPAVRQIPASVRVADLPASEPQLLQRLNAALHAANHHRMHIAEIQVPLSRYPALANTFWHVPIVDTEDPALRIVYSA